jgi:TonB family protein
VPILNNAAAFIQTTNPERAIDLFRQAEFLDAGKTQVYQGAIARIYAAAEVQMVHPEAKLNNIQMSSDTAARLRDQLLASHDPALLSQVGTALVKISRAEAADPQAALGLLLIYQAARLDPGNTKWTDALQSAKEEPRRRAAYAALMAGPPLQNGTIRIGAKIAEASLITKTDPVYPPLAIQNQIEGVVKFTVTVGTNGTVQELNLLSGHPVLVQAAKDAVLTYVYHPAKVDGQAVPFETEIAVPFRLP